MEEIEFNDIPEELAREYEMDKKNEEGLDMYQEFFINNLRYLTSQGVAYNLAVEEAWASAVEYAYNFDPDFIDDPYEDMEENIEDINEVLSIEWVMDCVSWYKKGLHMHSFCPDFDFQFLINIAKERSEYLNKKNSKKI